VAGASLRVRRSVARLGLPRQVYAMTATTLLPFQPDAMTPAQRAAVSYLARYSGHTHALYAYQLRLWFAWCENNGLDPLVGVQRAHIELYIRYLGESGLMASSINTSMHAVRGPRPLPGMLACPRARSTPTLAARGSSSGGSPTTTSSFRVLRLESSLEPVHPDSPGGGYHRGRLRFTPPVMTLRDVAVINPGRSWHSSERQRPPAAAPAGDAVQVAAPLGS
jgi:hypothetical protein